MENRVVTLEKEVDQLKQDNKRTSDRLNLIEGDKRLQEYQFKTITEALAEIKQNLKELNSKDGQKWGVIVTSVISAVSGGLITFALSRLL